MDLYNIKSVNGNELSNLVDIYAETLCILLL